jgi:hypothetical protein
MFIKDEEDMPLSHFGIETNTGWNNLLLILLTILSIIDTKKCIRITQIKEKFAGLRFYIGFHNPPLFNPLSNRIVRLIRSSRVLYRIPALRNMLFLLREKRNPYTDKIYDIISLFEEASFLICEKCGKPGVVREDRWWMLTLCDKCNEEDKIRDPDQRRKRHIMKIHQETEKIVEQFMNKYSK